MKTRSFYFQFQDGKLIHAVPVDYFERLIRFFDVILFDIERLFRSLALHLALALSTVMTSAVLLCKLQLVVAFV